MLQRGRAVEPAGAEVSPGVGAPASAGRPPRAAGPWLAFGTCAAIWSSTFLFISVGNDTVPPAWAATLRLALAALLLNLYRLARRQRWPVGNALRAALAYGVFNFGLSFPLLYWGETRVSSGLTAVIYAIIPLATALFARLLGLERLSRWRIVGAVLGLGGASVIFSDRLRADLHPLPLVAVLASAVSAALGGTLLRRGPRQDPIIANSVATAVAAPIVLLASFAFRESHVLPASAAAIFPILYLTILGSMGAFILYAWLVNRWPVTRISFIAVIVPVVALALGALVRHERFSGLALAGSALVLGGVVLGMRPWGAGRAGR